MPTEECGTNTPLYYSWDAGLVHFLSFSTEAYFTNPMEWGYIESQYNFLEADLIKANENRSKRPWIIMMGHRPLYCTGLFFIYYILYFFIYFIIILKFY